MSIARQALLPLILALLLAAGAVGFAVATADAQNKPGYLSSVYLTLNPTSVGMLTWDGGDIPTVFSNKGTVLYPGRLRIKSSAETSGGNIARWGTRRAQTFIDINPVENPFTRFNFPAIVRYQLSQRAGGDGLYRLNMWDVGVSPPAILGEATYIAPGLPGTVMGLGGNFCNSNSRQATTMCWPFYQKNFDTLSDLFGKSLALDFYDGVAEIANAVPAQGGRILSRMTYDSATETLACNGTDLDGFNCYYGSGNVPGALLDGEPTGKYDGSRISLSEIQVVIAPPAGRSWKGNADRDGWFLQLWTREGAAMLPEAVPLSDAGVTIISGNLDIRFQRTALPNLAEQNGRMIAVTFSENLWTQRVNRVPGQGNGFQLALMLIAFAFAFFGGLRKQRPTVRILAAALICCAVGAVPPFFFGVGNAFIPALAFLLLTAGAGLAVFARR